MEYIPSTICTKMIKVLSIKHVWYSQAEPLFLPSQLGLHFASNNTAKLSIIFEYNREIQSLFEPKWSPTYNFNRRGCMYTTRTYHMNDFRVEMMNVDNTRVRFESISVLMYHWDLSVK